MRRIVALLALALSGCTSTARAPINVVPAQTRDLTASEKSTLAPQISASLKDPAAAQFKWMPVIERQREGITDYCGLVNGKNSYGGYIGFSRFYAQLTQNEKGQFIKAEPRGFETPGSEVNIFGGSILGPGICEKFGYTDFSQAR